MSGKVVDKIQTPEEQRELFLWKFRDVKREDVMVLYKVGLLFVACTITKLEP